MGPDDSATSFDGAKGALLIGDRLLVTLRDDDPGISFPGLWDLPGGGREAGESPRETLAREVREEVCLDLDGAEWLWARTFPSGLHPDRTIWFFVLRLPADVEGRIELGDEGQAWRLMTPDAFVAMSGAVPFLQDRVALWLESQGR